MSARVGGRGRSGRLAAGGVPSEVDTVGEGRVESGAWGCGEGDLPRAYPPRLVMA